MNPLIKMKRNKRGCYTTQDVADLLNIPEATMRYHLTRHLEMEPTKDGPTKKRKYFSSDDVETIKQYWIDLQAHLEQKRQSRAEQNR